jgi:hypothetical protein
LTVATIALPTTPPTYFDFEQAKYDDHHAMVLTQIYDFQAGVLYLYVL